MEKFSNSNWWDDDITATDLGARGLHVARASSEGSKTANTAGDTPASAPSPGLCILSGFSTGLRTVAKVTPDSVPARREWTKFFSLTTLQTHTPAFSTKPTWEENPMSKSIPTL